MDYLVGRTLGPYLLQAKLGSGGMGTVYRATHQLLDQPRAVKVLPPNLAQDSTFVQRFLREARTAAKLRHPNIIPIYDVGEQDGHYFIAMELVQGVPLSDLMRKRLPAERVVSLLRQLAEALDYAHEQGMTHRDVKPANVLVGPDDHVTLIDFGIARAAEGTNLTHTGAVIGTPQYLAPEAITGAGRGPSVDLYALGIVAYEMLVGRTPFAGLDTHAMLYAHVNTTPPRPRSIRADVPTGDATSAGEGAPVRLDAVLRGRTAVLTAGQPSAELVDLCRRHRLLLIKVSNGAGSAPGAADGPPLAWFALIGFAYLFILK